MLETIKETVIDNKETIVSVVIIIGCFSLLTGGYKVAKKIITRQPKGEKV